MGREGGSRVHKWAKPWVSSASELLQHSVQHHRASVILQQNQEGVPPVGLRKGEGSLSVPSTEHFHCHNNPGRSSHPGCGAEKTKRVDEVKGPTQGHSLAYDRVPGTCLMPQPVFFPPRDLTSSPAPHIIGDQSRTRSKSGGGAEHPTGRKGPQRAPPPRLHPENGRQ